MTQKIKEAELWFMCTVFPHNVLYQCMKFQVNSVYSLEVMAWTKIPIENLQRAISQKEYQSYCSCPLHFSRVLSVYVAQVDTFYSLEVMA